MSGEVIRMHRTVGLRYATREEAVEHPWSAYVDSSGVYYLIRSCSCGRNRLFQFTRSIWQTGDQPLRPINETIRYCFYGRTDGPPGRHNICDRAMLCSGLDLLTGAVRVEPFTVTELVRQSRRRLV
jgi:hypothetical protein